MEPQLCTDFVISFHRNILYLGVVKDCLYEDSSGYNELLPAAQDTAPGILFVFGRFKVPFNGRPARSLGRTTGKGLEPVR